MAYVERDYLTEQFEMLLHDDNVMCPVVKVLDALEIIDTAPTADVVPRAEVEQLKHKYDLAIAEREANVKGFTEQLSRAKAEAIKEFAERLKSEEYETSVDAYSVGYILGAHEIDSLVEEMTGGAEKEDST